MSALNCGIWVAYAILYRQFYMMVSNIFGLVGAAVQLGLYLYLYLSHVSSTPQQEEQDAGGTDIPSSHHDSHGTPPGPGSPHSVQPSQNEHHDSTSEQEVQDEAPAEQDGPI
ncbi:hypothetical protein Tsubulata_030926 [Turnera subulata]|uniref:Bidirectional sugar transporter SWEET n=1 Tax=Turnera subulata TaxID=218843 RepID=A0A9Q0GB05_9ROSI|nr:hypothetical protein Tsubulata_030926 [Turnera subulata]